MNQVEISFAKMEFGRARFCLSCFAGRHKRYNPAHKPDCIELSVRVTALLRSPSLLFGELRRAVIAKPPGLRPNLRFGLAEALAMAGGEGGIRTPGTVASTTA